MFRLIFEIVLSLSKILRAYFWGETTALGPKTKKNVWD